MPQDYKTCVNVSVLLVTVIVPNVTVERTVTMSPIARVKVCELIKVPAISVVFVIGTATPTATPFT
jgi:hypothetical protein